jgi:hypothetical protein
MKGQVLILGAVMLAFGGVAQAKHKSSSSSSSSSSTASSSSSSKTAPKHTSGWPTTQECRQLLNHYADLKYAEKNGKVRKNANTEADEKKGNKELESFKTSPEGDALLDKCASSMSLKTYDCMIAAETTSTLTKCHDKPTE